MAKQVTCIEVKTADGKHIFSLYLHEKEVTRDTTPGNRNTQTASNSSSGDPMTDAQKRYLFRILAEQGYEGDKAHQHLKNLFGVDNLQEVSKQEASRMIESLLEKAESR
jgi:hypothetical protein